MTVLPLALLSLAGCHREDYSFCPPEVLNDNVTLQFKLRSGESFKSNVSSVYVGYFDGNGTYIKSERIEQAAINEFEGMVVTLAPGDYRMVFWANVNDNTKIDGVDGSSPKVTYSQMTTANPPVVGNGNDVYYAPYGLPTRAGEEPLEYYALTVPAGATYSDVIYFTHAHRSLEIYIKGLSGNPYKLPTVELTGLPAGLKYFGMEELVNPPLTVTSRHNTSLVTMDNIVYAAAGIHTFLFEDMEGINIIIRDSDGNELYNIPLADAIEESNADPDKIIIKLVFSFMNGKVEVSMPGWDSGETGIDF